LTLIQTGGNRGHGVSREGTQSGSFIIDANGAVPVWLCVMWILILFPIAWLMSEVTKMSLATRLTLGILAIAATAWLTYDVCTSEFELRERILRHQLQPPPKP
jgi:hypothetical protein